MGEGLPHDLFYLTQVFYEKAMWGSFQTSVKRFYYSKVAFRGKSGKLVIKFRFMRATNVFETSRNLL